MIIPAQYMPAFGKVFSPMVMDNLAKHGHSGYLSEICSNSGLFEQIDTSMELRHFFDGIYHALIKNYRNEYVFKNTIANKILLGRHSLNTSHMLTEFRVGNCKADVVVLNGTSTVYEIKSEFDTFSRLEKQVNAYFDIFDYINVITTPSQATKLDSILPEGVGILTLKDNNVIATIREAKTNKENINLEVLFDSLRKAEYTSLIKNYFGAVPSVPNTQIYKECKKLFCGIPKLSAHDLAIKILRNRSNAKVLKDFIDSAPYSLSAYALSICTDKSKMLPLMARYGTSMGSVLNSC